MIWAHSSKRSWSSWGTCKLPQECLLNPFYNPQGDVLPLPLPARVAGGCWHHRALTAAVAALSRDRTTCMKLCGYRPCPSEGYFKRAHHPTQMTNAVYEDSWGHSVTSPIFQVENVLSSLGLRSRCGGPDNSGNNQGFSAIPGGGLLYLETSWFSQLGCFWHLWGRVLTCW